MLTSLKRSHDLSFVASYLRFLAAFFLAAFLATFFFAAFLATFFLAAFLATFFFAAFFAIALKILVKHIVIGVEIIYNYLKKQNIFFCLIFFIKV